MAAPASTLQDLQCARCGARASADLPQGFCSCGGTYLARYDTAAAARNLTRSTLSGRGPGLWRWAEMLPVRNPGFRAGLGEGGTPLVPAERLAVDLGVRTVLLKDEGQNPGGSFKARGMAVAMARAVELGSREFALPSAGNAGLAAAAYGALWGAAVHVALPVETPRIFRRDVEAHGARCYPVAGDIADAGRWLAAQPAAADWFFLSTLKEPYRVEGKKTMGYELVEQLGGRWPSVVVYPTGGGTGIVGMLKADEELRAIGLVEGPPPRFVVVQAEGCAPLVRAFERGETRAEPWPNARTMANGLRVPATIGDHLILDGLRRTGGTALTVTDADMRAARRMLAARLGVFAAPEAAATWCAAERLAGAGWLRPDDDVVLFLTGNGFHYPDEEEVR